MTPAARCLSRTRTSAALGLRRGPKPSAASFSARAIGPVAASNASYAVSAASASIWCSRGECRLGFCERALEDRGTLDAASPRDPDRLRGSGDPPSAFELREPHLLRRDMALQLGDLGGEERAGGR